MVVLVQKQKAKGSEIRHIRARASPTPKKQTRRTPFAIVAMTTASSPRVYALTYDPVEGAGG